MQSDVLVIGAGPVGLTMAAELARYGVSVRIIDKAAGRTDKSKALVLWSRSLELIDRMGCGASFVGAGLKVTGANIIAGSRAIAHIPLDQLDTPHPYALMLPQSETERLMESHVNACGVNVEWQVDLERFVTSGDSVTATVHHPGSREEEINAKWMIGCDGAHSAVRHGLGMQFEGNTLPSDWVLADVYLTGLTGNANDVNTYWHSDGVLAIFPITPGRYRIIADIGDAKVGTLRPDPTLEEIQALLDRRGPGNIVASSPIWLASFRINERKVADYRAGRVFLAGDAAHIHSPAGGQGMNTGMQDACNLAWKLALVCRGLAAPEPLLESYSIERSAVGRQVLTDAGRLTTLAILRGGIAQSIRNHVASLVFGVTSARGMMANKLTELSISYPHSPLTLPARHNHDGPPPGERAPVSKAGDPVGAGGTPRFAVFAKPGADATAFIARHRDLVEPKARPVDQVMAGAATGENSIYLVRPDGYTAMVTGADKWAEVDSYLKSITEGLQA